jgi:hypothetical protein
MVQVIMVAEKPSICNAIAQALSGGNHETHGRTPPVCARAAPHYLACGGFLCARRLANGCERACGM